MRRLTTAVVAALAVLAIAGPANATNDKPPNEGVCPGAHQSAGNQATFTATAPEGKLISSICVKAGSVNQGNGPETIAYDPPVASATFSHSSGKDISHWSWTLVDKPEECEPDWNGGEPGCGEEPPPCEPDYNGEADGCGEPPECPNGDMNGDLPGCEPAPPPPTERCEPGEGPYDGKDGEEGNEECCPDADRNQECDEAGTPPTDTVTPRPPTPEEPAQPEKPEPPAGEEPETPKPEKPRPERPATEKPDGPKAEESPAEEPTAAGTLPHTGLPLLPIAILGGLSTLAGWRLRTR